MHYRLTQLLLGLAAVAIIATGIVFTADRVDNSSTRANTIIKKWDTYSNQRLGFSAQYPAEWQWRICSDNSVLFSPDSGPQPGCFDLSRSGIEIIVYSSRQYAFEWAVDIFRDGLKNSNKQTVTVAGRTATKVSGIHKGGEGPSTPEGTYVRRTVLLVGESLYIIDLQQRDGIDYSNVYEQMLMRFALLLDARATTNSNAATNTPTNTGTTANVDAVTNTNTTIAATSDWKTYMNTEEGYSLRYPPTWTIDTSYKGLLAVVAPKGLVRECVECPIAQLTVSIQTSQAQIDDDSNIHTVLVGGVIARQGDDNGMSTQRETAAPFKGKFLWVGWPSDENANGIYDLILSTFTFTN